MLKPLTGHNKPWKILKEIRIPDHLTCLLRNLYAGQKATVQDYRSLTNEVCVDMDSVFVGLHMKGVPTGKLSALSES